MALLLHDAFAEIFQHCSSSGFFQWLIVYVITKHFPTCHLRAWRIILHHDGVFRILDSWTVRFWDERCPFFLPSLFSCFRVASAGFASLSAGDLYLQPIDTAVLTRIPTHSANIRPPWRFHRLGRHCCIPSIRDVIRHDIYHGNPDDIHLLNSTIFSTTNQGRSVGKASEIVTLLPCPVGTDLATVVRVEGSQINYAINYRMIRV